VQESTHIEDPPVAVRVTRRVKPERVEEFEEWVSGITAATARFPGYLGAEVLKPGDPSDTDYHIHLQVRSYERPQALGRLRRTAGLVLAGGAVTRRPGPQTRRGRPREVVRAALDQDASPPPRYKMVAITWLAIYPLITAVFFFFGDPLQRLPLGFRTLAVTAIIVPAMLYLVLPLMTPLFARWLYPRESRETEEEGAER
jgi:antibiotic biosynthesis monooxygenase (ABM) superfamily enzyme